MPVVHIETVESLSIIQKQAVMKAANDAVIAALKIPSSECYVRYTEIEKENFYQPDLKEVRFFVEVKMFSGRSAETKRALYKLLDQSIKKSGVGAEKITVALSEIPMENWGINDGHPASEVQLEYRVNV